MKTCVALPPAKERIARRAYRTINIKTVRPVQDIAQELAEHEDSAPRVAYCMHPAEDGGVEHYHLVCQFNKPVVLQSLLRSLQVEDPHCYVAPCRSFRSSYRYLKHLDNPEKARISEPIQRLGDWDGVNIKQWEVPTMSKPTFTQLLDLVEEFVMTQANWSPCCFGTWLESNGYDAFGTLSRIRATGMNFGDLVQQVRMAYCHQKPMREAIVEANAV